MTMDTEFSDNTVPYLLVNSIRCREVYNYQHAVSRLTPSASMADSHLWCRNLDLEQKVKVKH